MDPNSKVLSMYLMSPMQLKVEANNNSEDEKEDIWERLHYLGVLFMKMIVKLKVDFVWIHLYHLLDMKCRVKLVEYSRILCYRRDHHRL